MDMYAMMSIVRQMQASTRHASCFRHRTRELTFFCTLFVQEVFDAALLQQHNVHLTEVAQLKEWCHDMLARQRGELAGAHATELRRLRGELAGSHADEVLAGSHADELQRLRGELAGSHADELRRLRDRANLLTADTTRLKQKDVGHSNELKKNDALRIRQLEELDARRIRQLGILERQKDDLKEELLEELRLRKRLIRDIRCMADDADTPACHSVDASTPVPAQWSAPSPSRHDA